MKKYIAEAFRLLLAAAHFAVGILAVCIVLGEENPAAPMNFLAFFGYKALGCAALYGIYRSFLWRGAHNLLPLCEKDCYIELTSPESDADRV